MRILYGVCGEGFGHSSRAKEIIEHLKKKGHKILILTYGQAYPVLKDFNTIKISGIHLEFNKNKLLLSKTVKQGVKSISKNIYNFKSIKEKISAFNPQLCITDMEPLVPIFSYLYKLPLISIDNQHRLTHLNLRIPKEYKKDNLIAKLAINTCVSKANAFIILSFTKQRPKSKNAFIVSPILRKEIINVRPEIRNYILVYLTKSNNSLIKILKTIKENFIVYGHDINKKAGNIKFKKTSPNFITDLKNCKAVIATSGFTLISESLYLKKPYFAIPLQGQFEQTLNALFLKNSKLGEFSENPTKQQIQSFLKNLNIYKSKLKTHKLNPKEALTILDKILKTKAFK